MTKNPSLPADIKEAFDTSRQVLTEYMRLIDLMISGGMGHPSAPPDLSKGFSKHKWARPMIPAMMQAMGSSTATIARLSDDPGLQTRDCYSICRSIVELAINICYICAKGEEAVNRAQRHAMQKSYRDLNRKSNIGDRNISFQFGNMDEIEMPQELQDAIDEFTSQRGREKGWTDLSVDDRCKAVGSVFGDDVLTPLHLARFAIYRHSSEILHGTFFSVMFFAGQTEPNHPKNPNEWIETIASRHIMILLTTIGSIDAVVNAISIITGVDELKAISKSLFDPIRKSPYFKKR